MRNKAQRHGDLLTYLLTYLHTYLLTYLLTYLQLLTTKSNL